MFACFAGILATLSLGIVAFIQTISFAKCTQLKCCCGRCVMGDVEIPDTDTLLENPLTGLMSSFYGKTFYPSTR